MLNKFQKFSKNKIRIGRGGKRGTTSGRGTKGQKSRAGHRIRPAERDLIIRIPKRRGFRNKILRDKAAVLNLSDLKGRLKLVIQEQKQPVLSMDVLKQAKVLPPDYRGKVKLLGNGEANFKFNVRGIAVSNSARAKIEKAGGKVENSK